MLFVLLFERYVFERSAFERSVYERVAFDVLRCNVQCLELLLLNFLLRSTPELPVFFLTFLRSNF